MDQILKDGIEEVKKFATDAQARFTALDERGQKTEEGFEQMKADFGEMSEKLQATALKAEAEEKAREELEIALAKMPEKSGDEQDLGDQEYRKGFGNYVRRGAMGLNEKLEAEGEALAKLYEVDEFDAQEVKALAVGSNPDLGYLAPIDAARQITMRIFESSPMRAISNVITTAREAVEVIIDDQEADSGWVGEMDARPETATPKIGSLEIPTHEQYAEPKATTKILDDASINVESWLSAKIAAKFGRVENSSFVVGDSVKKPTGFLTYPAWSDEEIYERGGLAQIETAGATTIAADDLIALMTLLIEDYQPSATWLMSRGTWGNDILTLKEATTGAYLINPQLIFQGVSFQLLGRPVRLAADMPDVANSSLSVAFGDFREGYTIVDRIGIRVLRDPYTSKGFVKYYTTKRVGGDVVNYQAIKILKTKSS